MRGSSIRNCGNGIETGFPPGTQKESQIGGVVGRANVELVVVLQQQGPFAGVQSCTLLTRLCWDGEVILPLSLCHGQSKREWKWSSGTTARGEKRRLWLWSESLNVSSGRGGPHCLP